MQRSSGSAIVGLRSTSMAAAELQSEAGPTGEGVRGLALEAGFDEAGLVALPHEEEERDAGRFARTRRLVPPLRRKTLRPASFQHPARGLAAVDGATLKLTFTRAAATRCCSEKQQ